MKQTNKIIFLLIILSLVISSNFSHTAPVRRALIIAIGNYPSNSGFHRLNSINDIQLIKTTLLNRMFEETNIKILSDDQATGQRILSYLEELVNISNKEDIVVIHFSGHGQQIVYEDINKSLCLDEALVAYDAFLTTESGYSGQNHIRDKVIGEYVKRLRLKLGKKGMLNLFIDCCYSGTMTKGINVFRGAGDVFGADDIKKKYYNSERSKIKGNFMYECISGLPDNQNEISDFVFFAPCLDNQPCSETQTSEGKWVGPLSYAISKAFATVKADGTYRDLFDIICASIISKSKEQIPQAEGDLDNLIFSPLVSYTLPYFSITGSDKNGFILNGGELHGIFPNTIIGLYPEGIDNPSGIEPLYEGKINTVMEFESRLEHKPLMELGIVKNPDELLEKLMKLRVFVIKQGLPNKTVTIKFMDLDENDITKLSDAINSVKYISITDSAADFILTGLTPDNDGKLHILSGKDGSSVSEPIDLNEINFEQKVVEKLKDLVVYSLLRDVELNDDKYSVEIDVQLVEWINFEKREYKLSPLNLKSGIKSIKRGETVKLTITNTGTDNAYITLLNFAPDGSLNQVIPEEGKSKSNILEKENTMEIPFVFQSNEPGLEIYKIFATKDFISFNPIIRSRGTEKTKGEKNSLEELLFDCYSGSKGSNSSFSGGTTNIISINVTE
jgi:hypothetical protein